LFDTRQYTLFKTIQSYNQQDATFVDLFIFKDDLHVSGGSPAHHQEHIAVQTCSGIGNQLVDNT
jgi:hypothetical protein